MIYKNIIIDCDPGTDDAIALALASSLMKNKIIGMVSSYGNTTLSNTHKNLVRIAGLLGITSPIFIGSAQPINNPKFTVTDYHGNNGLCGVELPSVVADYNSKVPFDRLYEFIKTNEGIVYVATGPLTNLATLFSEHSDVQDLIEKVVIMGGGIGIGNTHCGAEYNFSLDPIADDIVLKSKIEKALITLDLTHTLSLTDGEIRHIIGSHTAESVDKSQSAYKFMSEILFRNHQSSIEHGNSGAIIHDAATIAYLNAPDKCVVSKRLLKCDGFGCLSVSEDGDIVDYVEAMDKDYLMSMLKQTFTQLRA